MIHDYVADPLDRTQLTTLVTMVGGDPADMVRADIGSPSVDDVVSHLVDNPGDMQRPIAVVDEVGIIGRPPERILELLN